jgi:hypothetical protein
MPTEARICNGMLIASVIKIKTMAKDREGKFHPVKGKPSGRGRQKGVTAPPSDNKSLDDQTKLEDKYSIDADRDRADGVRITHPNRNTDKDQDRKLEDNKRQSAKTRRSMSREDVSGVAAEELQLSKDSIDLLESQQGKCITIFLPTHRLGADVNEQVDKTVFKDLIQRAASKLSNKNEDNTRILEPAYKLLQNDEFWKNTSAGLAFFIADGFFKYIQLPAAPAQKMVVNSSFSLAPLIPFITNTEYFYLLVISKKQSKLYRVDFFQIQNIPISELPRGMDDVIHFEEKDDQKLFRTGSSGAGGGANYHGIGAGKPDEKENISMYLAEVDNTLWQEVLRTENVPLLLAGVEYLIPLYKNVSRYNKIWDAALTGNFERENEGELYRQAIDVMQPYFQERTKLALAKYGDLSATSLTSTDPKEIIPAAYYSRVEQLFVAKDEHIWGNFDEKTQSLSIHNEENESDNDLLDKAVLRTYLNGGEVHIMSKELMPGKEQIAAIMRY